MNIVKTTTKVGDNAILKFNVIDTVDIRRNSIADICKDKRVLVIGCVDMIDMLSIENYINEGKHQFHNISKNAQYSLGIDINKEGINTLCELGYNVCYYDLFSNKENKLLEQEFDYVVISHVIEHVIDLTEFIRNILKKTRTKKYIFAVPNAYNIKHCLPAVLLQREKVSNDHYYTFTPVTFLKLMNGLEFNVEALYLDQDRRIRMGTKHFFLGTIWSFVKAKVFKHSGDIIAIVSHQKND